MNIYELPKEIEQALEKYYSCFDEDTGEMIVEDEVFEKIQAELFELQNKKEELLEWYLKDRLNKKAENEWIQMEIQRLQDRVARNNKKIDRVEKIVDYQFREDYTKPIALWNFTIAYRKSKSTIIEDENIIDFKYKKEKVSISIDKTAIKKAIESGEQVKWARISENMNLTIK